MRLDAARTQVVRVHGELDDGFVFSGVAVQRDGSHYLVEEQVVLRFREVALVLLNDSDQRGDAVVLRSIIVGVLVHLLHHRHSRVQVRQELLRALVGQDAQTIGTVAVHASVFSGAVLHYYLEVVIEIGGDRDGAAVQHLGKTPNHHLSIALGMLVAQVLY